MKSIILALLVLYVAVSSAQSQSRKNISDDKSTDISESVFSFRLKPVYTSVQNSKNSSYYDDGFGVTFTLQYDLSKLVSIFFDVNTSSIKFTAKAEEEYPPVYIDKGNQSSTMFVAGAKIYPLKLQYPMYIKAGIGFLSRTNVTSVPPLLNFGLGYEYKLSNIFNIFIEGEADYRSGSISGSSSTDLSAGLGISLYIGNLYGKW